MKKINPPFETRTAITLEQGGLKLFGVLHVPHDAYEVPCVLLLHGFGGHKVGKYRLAVRQAEALSKKGIASFRFDYRGCGDSEGDFCDITISSMLDDAIASLDFVKEHPQIDEKKIALCGRSMGGVLSALVAAKHPIQTLVLWAAMFDTQPWVTGEVAHHAIEKNGEGISFSGKKLNDTFLQEFRTLSIAKSLDALQERPICLIQGQKDKTLDMYHFDKYVEARKTAQAETKTVLLPNSGHDFEDVQEQKMLLECTTDWVNKCLN